VESTHSANGGKNIIKYIAGLLEQTIDADGITRTFAYEPEHGRLDTETDHQGNTILYGYDGRGNLTHQWQSGPDGGQPVSRLSRSFDHPALPGLLYRSFQPAPGDDSKDVYTQYGYDLAGNTNAVIDPKGQTTAYVFDSLNRLTEIVEPGQRITCLDYDRHGHLERITDANGQQTVYQYDDLGRLVAETSADTGTTNFEYDAAGSLISREDGRGVVVTFTPDVLGRTRQIDYPDYDGQVAHSVTYTYDEGDNGKGRLTAMSDASGSTGWDYSRFDDQGILEKTTIINGFSFTTGKTLTPAGRKTQLAYPSGRVVDYQRSACVCAVSGVTTTYNNETLTLLADIGLRPFALPQTMDIGNAGAPNIDNRYDLAGRLTAANPGAAHGRTYSHDANGNTTGISIANLPMMNQQFTYDHLDRLDSFVGPFGATSFDYDALGNRTRRDENGLVATFTYEQGTNRLSYIDRSDGEQTALSYDGHGNTVAIGDRVLTYNQDNRLARVDDSGFVAEYVYNGLGQRVIKTTADATTQP
jgi:YD repeat-containing protein